MNFFRYSDKNSDWPDIQLLCSSYADNTDGGVYSKRATGLSDDYYNQAYEPILYRDSFSIVPMLLRPKSRGEIRLKSQNPYDPPLIFPNYFQREEDVKVLVKNSKNFLRSDTFYDEVILFITK